MWRVHRLDQINAHKPAIHDRYLSRTDGVVLAVSPDGGFVSSRFLTGRVPCAPYRERICIRAVRFSAFEFLHRLGSTAKRDQSFICASPALREGLHGRLSLGNPPAL